MDTTMTLDAPETMVESTITLTENAAERLGSILDQKGLKDTHGLRVFVKGGGCGGMQYGMTFEDNFSEDDTIYESYGMRVVVDPTSLFYVSGASVDYVDNLMGGGFHIDNPNATSSCGCGSSFRTDGGAAATEGGAGCGQ